MGGETQLTSIMESYLAAAVHSAGAAGSYSCTLAVEPGQTLLKQGMRLDLKDGSVWIAPANDREALRVVTEGARAETALELCDFITNEAGKWDAL